MAATPEERSPKDTKRLAGEFPIMLWLLGKGADVRGERESGPPGG